MINRIALAALLFAACQNEAVAPQEEDITTGSLSYELQGPALRIEEPALGAFIEANADDLIYVRGTSRAKSVTIDGVTAQVDSSGHFEALVQAYPGVNVLRATASGIFGVEGERAFIYGEFTAPAAANPHAVVVRLNRPAFQDQDDQMNDISSVATYSLSRFDLFDALTQPFVFTYDFVIGSLDLNVQHLDYDGASSTAYILPREGGAVTSGHFGKLGLDMGLTLHLFGTYSAHARVDVSSVAFGADIVAGYQGEQVSASLANLALDLGDIQVTTDLPASSYLDQIVAWIANLARTEVANEVATQVEQNAANYFALALNQLALPPFFDLSSYGVNATLATTYKLDGATFDSDGVAISAAPALSWPDGTATSSALQSPGSLWLGSTKAMPEMPHDATVALSLSFDLLNQALYAVWGQNGLSRTVWNGGKKWGVTFDPLTVQASLPPVLTPTEDGAIRLTVGDLLAHTRVSFLGFSGDIDVALSLAQAARLTIAPEGDRLQVTLEGAPAITVDINSLLGIVPNIAITAIEKLIEDMGPQIAAQLALAMAVPLPSLPLDQIKGFEGHKLALAPPGNITVDTEATRVLVTASFVLKTPN